VNAESAFRTPPVKSKSRSWLLALVGFSLVLALLVAGCGNTSTDEEGSGSSDDASGTYDIGYSAALSGALAPYETEYLAGVELGVKTVNGDGGAGGYKLKLLKQNNESDPAKSRLAAVQLADDGANALLCTSDADPAIPCAQVAAENEIPSISFASSPSLVKAVPESFLTYSPDNVVSAALAEFALDKGWETAYVVTSTEATYTKAVADYFTTAFEDGGGKVVGTANYNFGQTDFNSIVSRIAGANPAPDVIFTPAYPPESNIFVRQLQAQGVDTPILTTDANDTPLFLDAIGDADNIWYSVQGYAEKGDTSTPTGEFNELYRKNNGSYPETGFPALGYDTIMLLADAVEEAGTKDGPAVIEALENLDPVDGAAGTIQFSPDDHLPVKAMTILKVDNGKVAPVDEVEAENVPAP
jgi:branched-chain amino acid transport system substrate-binding protein